MTLLILLLSCQTSPNRTPQNVSDATGIEVMEDDIAATTIVPPATRQCFSSENTNFASNQDMTINGKFYPRDTQFTIHQDENGDLLATAHLTDGSGELTDEEGSYDFIPDNNAFISCENFTNIPSSTNALGDVVLGEYSLPIDYDTAGTGQTPKKRKKGTTYCYREVKRLVAKKITLTGAYAYMAEDQLRNARGWTRYTNYNSAPRGSICVFGPGGRVTKSGGHKYGHIGIKGKTGVINPQAGFDLGRPFYACYYKA